MPEFAVKSPPPLLRKRSSFSHTARKTGCLRLIRRLLLRLALACAVALGASRVVSLTHQPSALPRSRTLNPGRRPVWHLRSSLSPPLIPPLSSSSNCGNIPSRAQTLRLFHGIRPQRAIGYHGFERGSLRCFAASDQRPWREAESRGRRTGRQADAHKVEEKQIHFHRLVRAPKNRWKRAEAFY